MMARTMTDENAKAVVRSFVEEALQESRRDDAIIDRVYQIPDRHLYVAVVVVEGNKFRVNFPFEELTRKPDKSRQQARLFVKDGLPKRTR